MAIIGNKIVLSGGKKVSKELKITKERIKKLAEGLHSCPEARDAVKDAFPEAFGEEWVDVTGGVKVYLENRGGGFRLFMDDEKGNYFAFTPRGKQDADISIPLTVSYSDKRKYKLELYGENNIRILKKT